MTVTRFALEVEARRASECASGYCGWSPEGDPHTCPAMSGSHDPPLRFKAWLRDEDGQIVGDSGIWRADPRTAAVNVVIGALPLYRMRPATARRGPDVVVHVLPGEGWPLSNLHPDGCKHDVTDDDEQRLARGLAVPCAKCGARLVPVCERCARVQRGEAPYHSLQVGSVALHVCDHTEKGPAVPGPCPCGCEP